ncbi:MAG TPA: TIGR03619 family F420-dependent LLM class oxidoreductase [Acidimicrobiia bacterium]|nr:TIGR03619 family F420-dependent LLM class oxidoreductase [Acidimicrobiia bacterium]
MKFGIALGRLNPAFFVDVTLEAERLGFESVWLPEHLIFTTKMSRSPHPGETHPPVPPETPIFDAFSYLSYLAGVTERVRLGTHVYNLGLRHPFVAARAVQTLDIVSGGRVEFGIGASWLEEEWVAAELNFATRGRRVDEALEVCKRLWTEADVSFDGEFFSFEGAVFEPKCVQSPYPPVLVGGESGAALRRAARAGDGWIGMNHDFDSGAAQITKLRDLLSAEGRDPDDFQYCLGGPVESADDVARWSDIGVTRLVFAPWRRSREAVDGMRHFADMVALQP